MNLVRRRPAAYAGTARTEECRADCGPDVGSWHRVPPEFFFTQLHVPSSPLPLLFPRIAPGGRAVPGRAWLSSSPSPPHLARALLVRAETVRFDSPKNPIL